MKSSISDLNMYAYKSNYKNTIIFTNYMYDIVDIRK